MRTDDFFQETSDAVFGMTTRFRDELAEALIRRRIDEAPDIDAATVLADLTHQSLVAFGTGGTPDLPDSDLALALRALKAVLTRLRVEHDIPWRNYQTFKAYWLKEGAAGTGGYAARRTILARIFEPIHAELEQLEGHSLSVALAEPITSHPATGWTEVDVEISELRRGFRTATTPQDYRNVGNHATGVIEALSRTLYDPTLHSPVGDPPLDPGKTKLRIGAFVRAKVPGAENDKLRALINAAIELAHSVKHSTAPTRVEAGIAGDSVILLANLLCRLDELSP